LSPFEFEFEFAFAVAWFAQFTYSPTSTVSGRTRSTKMRRNSSLCSVDDALVVLPERQFVETVFRAANSQRNTRLKFTGRRPES